MGYKVNYIVKKDEGVVVCILNDTKYYFSDYIMARLLRQDYRDIVPSLHNEYFLKNSYSGVARCAPGDEWNEELGRKIAFNKAKIKLNMAFFKRAQLYVDNVDREFNSILDAINGYGDRVEADTQKREEEIERLLNNSEE